MINIILLILVVAFMASVLLTTFWDERAVWFYVVGIMLAICLIITTGYFGG